MIRFLLLWGPAATVAVAHAEIAVTDDAGRVHHKPCARRRGRWAQLSEALVALRTAIRPGDR